MSEFSPIACEICRTKKRKVGVEYISAELDVFLFVRAVRQKHVSRTSISESNHKPDLSSHSPTCSQCVHASQTCTYPGTSKRGLPSGYIAKIEERLAQTEAALLQALSSLHALEAQRVREVREPVQALSALSERPRELEFNEIRMANVENWKAFPLGNESQQVEWMRYKLAKSDGLHDQEGAATHIAETELSRMSGDSTVRDQLGPATKRRKAAMTDTQRQALATPPPQAPVAAASISQGTTSQRADQQAHWPIRTPQHTAANLQLGSNATRHSTEYESPLGQHVLETTIFVSPNAATIRNAPTLSEAAPPSKAKRLSALHSRKYF
ncbi:hypothetical protein E4T42_06979 [Aureobasidium subglaciale]|nr:hypothetical protein E4T42_06979 [Aureobasidium subglaciale]